MRKALSITELIEEYQLLSPELISKEMPKNQRRDLWRWRLLSKYPDLDSCPFCNSNYNDGMHYAEGVKFQSLHRSGNLPYIECENCNLKFQGVAFQGSVIDQWNAAPRLNQPTREE